MVHRGRQKRETKRWQKESAAATPPRNAIARDLEDILKGEGEIERTSGHMMNNEEKPTKKPGKLRGRAIEGYRHMRHRKG